jgi:hypothetical protein
MNFYYHQMNFLTKKSGESKSVKANKSVKVTKHDYH